MDSDDEENIPRNDDEASLSDGEESGSGPVARLVETVTGDLMDFREAYLEVPERYNAIQVHPPYPAEIDDKVHKTLCRAACQGNLQECRRLFNGLNESARKKYKANRIDCYNGPLHYAAQNGHLQVVRFFLQECGFHVDQHDAYGYTPLARTADLETSRLLLEKRADPNKCPRWIRHPLFRAIIAKNHSLLQLLLENGADPNFQRATTPFFERYDVEKRPPAVVMAILQGDAESLAILLQHGAHVRPAALGWFYKPVLVEHLYDEGHSHETKVAICRTLAEHATSGDRSTKVFLQTSLANLMHDRDYVDPRFETLLEAGIVPMSPAMHRAVKESNELVCRLLVQHGVDPFQQESRGRTMETATTSLFRTAAKQKDTKVLEVFLDHWEERFSSNGGKNNDGDYPIHVLSCIQNVSLEAIKLVLERQAHTASSVDGEQGILPFHFAAMWNVKLDVLYSLVRHCPGALDSLRSKAGLLAGGADDDHDGMKEWQGGKEDEGPLKKKAKRT